MGVGYYGVLGFPYYSTQTTLKKVEVLDNLLILLLYIPNKIYVKIKINVSLN